MTAPPSIESQPLIPGAPVPPKAGATGGGLFGGGLASLKEGLKKYGRTGLVVYLSLSFSVTTGFYLALERNVDVKKLMGMKDDPNKEQSWVQSILLGKGSNLALAIICSKACVPIKIPISLAITPYVHRWQERIFKGWAMKKAQQAKP